MKWTPCRLTIVSAQCSQKHQGVCASPQAMSAVHGMLLRTAACPWQLFSKSSQAALNAAQQACCHCMIVQLRFASTPSFLQLPCSSSCDALLLDSPASRCIKPAVLAYLLSTHKPPMGHALGTPHLKHQGMCAGPSVTASELSAMADIVYGFEEACVDMVINLSDSDFPVQVCAPCSGPCVGSALSTDRGGRSRSCHACQHWI